MCPWWRAAGAPLSGIAGSPRRRGPFSYLPFGYPSVSLAALVPHCPRRPAGRPAAAGGSAQAHPLSMGLGTWASMPAAVVAETSSAKALAVTATIGVLSASGRSRARMRPRRPRSRPAPASACPSAPRRRRRAPTPGSAPRPPRRCRPGSPRPRAESSSVVISMFISLSSASSRLRPERGEVRPDVIGGEARGLAVPRPPPGAG